MDAASSLVPGSAFEQHTRSDENSLCALHSSLRSAYLFGTSAEAGVSRLRYAEFPQVFVRSCCRLQGVDDRRGLETEHPSTGICEDQAGTYIVFTTESGLALLTNASELSEVLSLYQEVARLGNEQKSLEAKQAPLAKQQEALAAQMKKAVSPEEMRRVGAEQGRIGLEQGVIGRDQGRVGQEQGEAGRAFYDEVQASLKACMQNRSCPAA